MQILVGLQRNGAATVDISVDDDLDFFAPPLPSAAIPLYHLPRMEPEGPLNGHPRIPPEMGGYFRVDERSSSGNRRPARYFAKHPEWYSYVRPEGEVMRRTPIKLCFTNLSSGELVERAWTFSGNPASRPFPARMRRASGLRHPNCSASPVPKFERPFSDRRQRHRPRRRGRLPDLESPSSPRHELDHPRST